MKQLQSTSQLFWETDIQSLNKRINNLDIVQAMDTRSTLLHDYQ